MRWPLGSGAGHFPWGCGDRRPRLSGGAELRYFARAGLVYAALPRHFPMSAIRVLPGRMAEGGCPHM